MNSESSAQRTRGWLSFSRWWYLPAIWSNCLAGAWLGGYVPGAERWDRLAILLAGASALASAGMFLDDDVAVRKGTTRIGLGLLAVGVILLGCLGWMSLVFAVALGGWVLLGSRWPQLLPAGPALLAGGQFLLYPLASAGSLQPTLAAAAGEGLLLAAYIGAASFLARGELSPDQRPPRWPWLLIVLPVVVNGVLSARFGPRNLIVVVLPAFWLARVAFGRTPPLGLGRTQALWAGTVLVDLSALVACTAFLPWLGWFAILFVLALTLQRMALAT